MNVHLDLIPMALCGLATLVAVAIILVVSDLLRRFVLFLIAKVDPGRRARTTAGAPRPAANEPPDDGDATALPG